ncbi:MAG: ABC transporter permease [Chloroflexi bacterium]|nr:ABC transporter permease [Chloroflexota bacterium]
MTRYVTMRLAAVVPVLIVVSMLAFALTTIAGGDPALEAALQGGGQATPAVVAQLRQQMHLDDPLPVRYVAWLASAARGDLGTSYATGRPVAAELGAVIPNTLLLASGALVVAAVLGLLGGLAAALQYNRWPDRLLRLVISSCLALPGFWLGFLLIFLFGETLHWLPAGGFGFDAHLLLPCLALGIEPAAGAARLVRSSLIGVLSEDYIRTARATGLAPAVVSWRHALPNSLLPAVTYLGVQGGHVLGGAVVIETIFAWPGVGRIVLAAVSARDLATIAAYVLFAGVTFSAVSLTADVFSSVIDPRLRLS